MNLLFCLAAALSAVTAAGASSAPLAWPGAFDVSFRTPTNSTGVLRYGYGLYSAQRIDHEEGAYECEHFYNISRTPCSILFLEASVYVLTPAGTCCQDAFLTGKGVGAPPPAWMLGDGPVAANGTEPYGWPPAPCDRWVFSESEGHLYYTAEGRPAQPCGFTFPDKGAGVPNPQNMLFDASTFRARPQPAALFRLPLGARCSSPCAA